MVSCEQPNRSSALAGAARPRAAAAPFHFISAVGERTREQSQDRMVGEQKWRRVRVAGREGKPQKSRLMSRLPVVAMGPRRDKCRQLGIFGSREKKRTAIENRS